MLKASLNSWIWSWLNIAKTLLVALWALFLVVDHVEGLLELLDLVLVEHSEDIAGGSLGPLLGGPSAGSLTRRHLGWNVLL